MNMSSMVLILEASGEMSIGGIIGIIVFFVLIIGGSIAAVVGDSKKGAKNIKEKFGDQILEEGTFSKSLHYFFTQNELIAQKYSAVFAIYRLSDIRSISIRWDTVQRTNVLYMTDSEGKRVKPAEVIGGTKAARKMYGGNALAMNKEDAEKLCRQIMKYAPHVQFEEK